MDTIGWDIYLDVSFLKFDGSDVQNKSLIILEQGKTLPLKLYDIFVDEVRVPYKGRIKIALTVKRSASITRKILSVDTEVPPIKWYSYIGHGYNICQKALQHIPVIGKPLEKVAPDAFQKVKLVYEISLTETRLMKYWIGLLRCADKQNLRTFKGEFLLI